MRAAADARGDEKIAGAVVVHIRGRDAKPATEVLIECEEVGDHGAGGAVERPHDRAAARVRRHDQFRHEVAVQIRGRDAKPAAERLLERVEAADLRTGVAVEHLHHRPAPLRRARR